MFVPLAFNIKYQFNKKPCQSLSASSNDPQKDECEHPEYAQFLTCIHHEFLRACIRNTTDATCRKIKSFIKKCPAKRDLLFES